MQRMSRRHGSTQAVASAVEEEPTVLDDYSHLLVETGADPWVTCYNGQFLYCRSSDDRQIAVGKADHLADIAKDVQVVWEATEDGHLSREVWAPELHRIAHKWYIYFTAGLFDQHRMYVLESVTDDPQGEYTLKGKISDATDGWAIDGTVVGVEGTNYFVWSGWGPRGHGQQNLYIAEMSSPWEIIGPKVCIAAPEHAWEHSAIVAPNRLILGLGLQPFPRHQRRPYGAVERNPTVHHLQRRTHSNRQLLPRTTTSYRRRSPRCCLVDEALSTSLLHE